MSVMKIKLIGLGFLSFLICSGQCLTETTKDGSVLRIGSMPSWYEFIGTCGGTIRPEQRVGVLRNYPWGSGPRKYDVTDEDHSGVEPVVGRFSKLERYYNFSKGDEEMEKAIQAKKTVLPIWEATLNPTIDYLLDEDGNKWKDYAYEEVKHFNTERYKDYPIQYWQLGNEINDITYFNPDSLDLSKVNHWDYFGNLEITKKYVELFFAPSVEAIRTASYDVYKDERRVKVVLGSAACAPNKKAIQWLNELLDMEIEGKFAPTLKGKKVYQVTDVISVHYIMKGNPKENDEHRLWNENLEILYEKWLATKKVPALWDTEDLGETKGCDGADLSVMVFRYFDWWSKHDYKKDRGKCIFWGDWWSYSGYPTTVLAEQLLGDYLGDSPLTNCSKDLKVMGDAGLEAYAFKSKREDGDNYLVGVFLKDYIPPQTRTEEQFFIDKVVLSTGGDSIAGIRPRFSAKCLQPEKLVTIPANSKYESAKLEFKVGRKITKDSVLFLFASFGKEDYGIALGDFKELPPPPEENRVLSETSEIISFSNGNWIGEGWTIGGLDAGMKGDSQALVAHLTNGRKVSIEVVLKNDYGAFKTVSFQTTFSLVGGTPGKIYWDDHLVGEVPPGGKDVSFEVKNENKLFSKGKHELRLDGDGNFLFAIDAVKIEEGE